MNGIFIADLIVYLILLPLAIYNFITHRWTGFLPWYFTIVFCGARIAGGALGIHDNSSLAPNIIQSVAITPLILGVDGLTHEARVHRYPSQHSFLNWTVVTVTSVAMIAAIGLSIEGAINIFQHDGNGSSRDFAFWKAGSALMMAVWGFELFWAVYSIAPSRRAKMGSGGAGYQGSTVLLRGSLVALIFIGIRVIYALVAVATGREDLNPVYGKTVVRVVLMFLPEALATIVMLLVGFKTRHLRALKRSNRLSLGEN
ncbi:hypothetical protein BJX63DRAFT_440185 [Aspergillus granulosus]|uniref:DUF7702 domain-containing protein n=1 Tax=Aspergillus granulosus TaxID=176169 RepID=A0ABR4GWC1_9EURO